MNSNTHTLEDARPTYCDFGLDRMKKWPGYFFCSPCSIYENEKALGNKRAMRQVKKHQCTAGHANFSVLTTKVKNGALT